jgi:Tol biopolymer transport system component
MRLRARFAILATAATLAFHPQAGAQAIIRPAQPWRSVLTEHFRVLFPESATPWALDIASRLERTRAAVTALVGYAPPATHRVSVLVDDPFDAANGFALPFLRSPTIVLWPEPPEPTDDIGNYRVWGRLLATHEYTHIAHLTRPSRNPWQRTLWELLPESLGPIARRAPRWVMEGYATYVEGRLTGSGRPNGALRAATLRELALEGQMPTYGELDGSGRYDGGTMAYLAGSAYLEWLTNRAGDSSLPHLWRRMTARADRGFVDAFYGVYGDTPDELYGRFVSELTGKSLAAAAQLRLTGLDTGSTVRRLGWYSGPPAISPNGELIAATVRARDRASRVIIWPRRASAAESTAVERNRHNILARDPDDVLAVRTGPIRPPPIAQLQASHGRAFDEPRFIPNGPEAHLLVSQLNPLPDGALRPDLFEWTPRTGAVRRITHGADVHAADPAPDGRTAIAQRCHDGACDLVAVRLADGTVTTIRAGSPTRSYDHPRIAPDGRSAVVAVHDSVHWTIERIDWPAADSERTIIASDDGASRYDPAFTRDGRQIVFVSEAGGAPHLAVIDLAGGAERVLTGTTGPVFGPEPDRADSSIYFTIIHASGRDLQRVPLAAARTMPAVIFADSLAPAAVPAPPAAPPLADVAPAPLPPVERYHATPRGYRVLPGGAVATDGRFATLAVTSNDLVGQFSWALQGAIGDAGTWRGGSWSAAWRGWPVTVDGQLFAVHDDPSRQVAGTFAPPTVDADYQGAILGLSFPYDASAHSELYRLGLSAGNFAPRLGADGGRVLGYAQAATAIDFTHGDLVIGTRLGVNGSAGQTAGDAWQRFVASASVHVGTRTWGYRGDVSYGEVNGGAPPFERFLAGGVTPPLTDSVVLSQRIAEPALPLGIGAGRAVMRYRIATDGPILAYFDGLSAGGSLGSWHRLYGAETNFIVPPLSFAHTPAVAATAGLGYSLNEPFKYKLRGYLAIRYQP